MKMGDTVSGHRSRGMPDKSKLWVRHISRIYFKVLVPKFSKNLGITSKFQAPES